MGSQFWSAVEMFIDKITQQAGTIDEKEEKCTALPVTGAVQLTSESKFWSVMHELVKNTAKEVDNKTIEERGDENASL